MMRLLQIEGSTFVENVVDTFAEEGIPKEKVEEVLAWAIGEDFHKIRLTHWPHRLRERLHLDIADKSKIKDGIIAIAKAWKEERK